MLLPEPEDPVLKRLDRVGTRVAVVAVDADAVHLGPLLGVLFEVRLRRLAVLRTDPVEGMSAPARGLSPVHLAASDRIEPVVRVPHLAIAVRMRREMSPRERGGRLARGIREREVLRRGRQVLALLPFPEPAAAHLPEDVAHREPAAALVVADEPEAFARRARLRVGPALDADLIRVVFAELGRNGERDAVRRRRRSLRARRLLDDAIVLLDRQLQGRTVRPLERHLRDAVLHEIERHRAAGDQRRRDTDLHLDHSQPSFPRPFRRCQYHIKTNHTPAQEICAHSGEHRPRANHRY